MKLSPEQQLVSMTNSIAKIPPINQRVLWILTQLLKLIHDQAEVNSMHSGNLSVIFAPKIIQPKSDVNLAKTSVFNQIVELLILQGDSIFTTERHSTPPDWSFILDPERPPAARRAPQRAPAGKMVLSEDSFASLPSVAFKPAPVPAPTKPPSSLQVPAKGRRREKDVKEKTLNLFL